MPTIIQPPTPELYIAYTAQELKVLFPDAFERALEKHVESEYNDPYYADEIYSSYEAILEILDIEMGNYCFDYFEPYRNKPDFRDDDALDLEGLRAYKYVVNRLESKLYNPWYGLFSDSYIEQTRLESESKPHTASITARNMTRRKKPYGKPWVKNDCPLTGVCFDEYLLEKLYKYLLVDKATLKDALTWLMDDTTQLIVKEYESHCTESYFIEDSNDRDLRFTESGEPIY